MDKGRGISRNSVTTITGVSFQGGHVSDFGSDLGRKKFGFSREELETPGAYYEGQFKLYQRSGYGTIFFPDNGERYMGQFSSDLYHGEGFRVWADGSEYRGQWCKGQKSGKGEYVSPESLRYVGQWESGRRHGQGTQEYANGDRYEGWWLNGMCSGLGNYYFVDGSRYEGAWAQGCYDGPGTYHRPDGTKEKHVYRRGVLQSRDVIIGGGAGASEASSPRRPVKGRQDSKGKACRTAYVQGMRPVVKQRRAEMQETYVLPPLTPSAHLIKREGLTREEMMKPDSEISDVLLPKTSGAEAVTD